MENGNHADQEEIEQARQACYLGIRVAKEQHKDLLKVLLELYPDFVIEEYEAAHLKFLKIPRPIEEIDISFLINHLKKFHVSLNHMLKEDRLNDSFRQSLQEARNHTSALIVYLTQLCAAMRESEGDCVDEGYPPVAEEIRAGSSLSKRQRRDCLVVRDYSRYLDVIENVLQRLGNQST